MKLVFFFSFFLFSSLAQDIGYGLKDNDGFTKFERIGMNEKAIVALKKRIDQLEDKVKKLEALIKKESK